MHNFERQMCRIFNMCTASIQTNSGSSLIVTLIKIARSLPNLEPQQGMTLMLHYSTLFFSRSWSLDIFLQRAVNNESMSGKLSTSKLGWKQWPIQNFHKKCISPFTALYTSQVVGRNPTINSYQLPATTRKKKTPVSSNGCATCQRRLASSMYPGVIA